MSAPSHSLPTELKIPIIQIAARQSRSTAATLSLVSRWVQELVTPILYSPVLALREQSSEKCAKMLSSPKFISHLENFGFRSRKEPGTRTALSFLSLAKPKPRIRNLYYSLGFIPDLDQAMATTFPLVEELHVQGVLPTITMPRWIHLRRIHVVHEFLGPTSSRPPFRPAHMFPSLTHIALTVDLISVVALKGVPTDMGLVGRIRSILTMYPSILIVAIRLFHSDETSQLKDLGEVIQDLDSIRDLRIVVMLFPQGPFSTDEIYDEWERNAERGMSFWAEAEKRQASHSVVSSSGGDALNLP